MNRISAELELYNISKNRTGNLITSNELTLPVTLDDCLINANESYQATSTTINKVLSGLYTNLMYVYSRCFLLENNLPTNTPSYIGIKQNNAPSILTIEDINTTSTTTLLNAKTKIEFTVNRFIENYPINIPIGSTATPPLTLPKDIAYTYVNVLTSLPGDLFIGETPVETSGSYFISLTGKTSTSLNKNFNTNPSDIFLTTSTFSSNNGVISLTESINNDLFVKFSYSSKLSAGMDDLVDLQVGYNYYTGKNIIFCASKTRLYIYTNVNNVFELVYSSNTVGYKRDIVFTNITSILINNTTLYVTDGYYNSVYKLDASGFLSNNYINRNRLIVDHIIGGEGTNGDITQFSNPEIQFIHNNEIYIYDKNNKSIKIYDLTLNFIRVINLSTLFNQYPFITNIKPFIKNIKNGIINIFLLSTYTIIDKTSSYTINSIVNINADTFEPLQIVNIAFNNLNEKINGCVQSTSDPDIIYIVTNISLYKFNTTNFSQVGVFEVSNPCNKLLALLQLDNKDVMYLYSVPGYGLFTKYTEESIYTSLLTNNDFKIYSLQELFINEDENQTFFVYNKTFKKIFYNTQKLLTNISFRPSYALLKNSNLNTHIFQGLEYLDNTTIDNLQLNETKDFFIGENEIFCNSVINRVITKFYKVLELALNSISNNVYTDFNTITLPSSTSIKNAVIELDGQEIQFKGVVSAGSFIMTEEFSPATANTYNSIILTEDGRGIILESPQGVSSGTPPTTTTGSIKVDNNITVSNPVVTTTTLPVLVPGGGTTTPVKVQDNVILIPGTTIVVQPPVTPIPPVKSSLISYRESEDFLEKLSDVVKAWKLPVTRSMFWDGAMFGVTEEVTDINGDDLTFINAPFSPLKKILYYKNGFDDQTWITNTIPFQCELQGGGTFEAFNFIKKLNDKIVLAGGYSLRYFNADWLVDNKGKPRFIAIPFKKSSSLDPYEFYSLDAAIFNDYLYVLNRKTKLNRPGYLAGSTETDIICVNRAKLVNDTFDINAYTASQVISKDIEFADKWNFNPILSTSLDIGKVFEYTAVEIAKKTTFNLVYDAFGMQSDPVKMLARRPAAGKIEPYVSSAAYGRVYRNDVDVNVPLYIDTGLGNNLQLPSFAPNTESANPNTIDVFNIPINGIVQPALVIKNKYLNKYFRSTDGVNWVSFTP